LKQFFAVQIPRDQQLLEAVPDQKGYVNRYEKWENAAGVLPTSFELIICGLKYQPESLVEAVQGWAVVINTSLPILFKAKINLIVHLYINCKCECIMRSITTCISSST